MKTSLVTLEDGTLKVSTHILAEQSGVELKSIMRLLSNHKKDFELFEGVRFEIIPLQTNGGIQKVKVALLNEEQTTLLLTYLNNTNKTKALKISLVKEFYQMRESLKQIEKAYHDKHSTGIVNQDIINLTNSIVEQNKVISAQTALMAKRLETVESTVFTIKATVEDIQVTNALHYKVAKDSNEFLRHQPMSKTERNHINTKIRRRGQELAEEHGISLANATASVYRTFNAHFNIVHYYDLPHKKFIEAFDTIEDIDMNGCNISGWEEGTFSDGFPEEQEESRARTASDIYPYDIPNTEKEI